MKDHGTDVEGFSLVEVIIAMFLLGLVAIAILPGLWQGTMLSMQQSATATATRHLNAIVEQARSLDPTCSSLVSFSGSPPEIEDGQGRDLIVSTTVQITEQRVTDSAPRRYTVDQTRCGSNAPTSLHDVTLDFTVAVADSNEETLASSTARIYVK